MAAKNKAKSFTYTTVLADGRRTTETLREDGSVVAAGDPAVLAEAARRAFFHMHGVSCPDGGAALAAPGTATDQGSIQNDEIQADERIAA